MQSKLDRYFCNEAFINSFGTLIVLCLHVPSSNHHVILLKHSQPSTRDGVRLHNMDRLEPWWLDHSECKIIIQEKWIGTTGMSPQIWNL